MLQRYRGSGPEINPWLGLRGFTVTYRGADWSTLNLIRTYQQRVRTEAPGWLTRLDVSGRRGDVHLHVFPSAEAMASVLFQPNRYGLPQ